MTAVLQAFQWASHYSVALMTAVFIMIVVATYWPSRRRTIEQQGRIPFKDDV